MEIISILIRPSTASHYLRETSDLLRCVSIFLRLLIFLLASISCLPADASHATIRSEGLAQLDDQKVNMKKLMEELGDEAKF